MKISCGVFGTHEKLDQRLSAAGSFNFPNYPQIAAGSLTQGKVRAAGQHRRMDSPMAYWLQAQVAQTREAIGAASLAETAPD